MKPIFGLTILALLLLAHHTAFGMNLPFCRDMIPTPNMWLNKAAYPCYRPPNCQHPEEYLEQLLPICDVGPACNCIGGYVREHWMPGSRCIPLADCVVGLD